MNPAEEALAKETREETRDAVNTVARDVLRVGQTARRLWYGLALLAAIAGAGWIAAMKYAALVQAAEFEPVRLQGMQNTSHVLEHDRAIAELRSEVVGAVTHMEQAISTNTTRLENKVDAQSGRIDRLTDSTKSAVRAMKEGTR